MIGETGTGRFATFSEIAADTHDLFMSYTLAGFTPEQALYLVGQLLTSGVVDEPDD